MKKLNAESILVTGGTGSFGKAFVKTILTEHHEVRRLVVFSRDELKQYEMEQEFPRSRYPQMRYFIGDVRDRNRLVRACEGVDTIIHAAALKQVPAAENNPMECIMTNINGAENVINAALDSEVRNVVALSTDKAAAPINLYGATKLCSDKLFVAANNIKGSRDLKLSVVRYGNVMGSRGSVIPFFLKKRNEGTLPITDVAMTRFNISLSEGVAMVLHALRSAQGGEIFVPKIPSYRITDVATAIAPKAKQVVIGIRPGEKVHEEMITSSDSFTTVDLGTYYAILPQGHRYSVDDYCRSTGAKRIPEGFVYNSGTNDAWLSVEDIRKLITLHVDTSFQA
jgi:UDP-N-acetylglucosamine 4,6-dehydratase